MGPEKTEDLLKGLKPMSCKGQVQKLEVWLKTKAFCQWTRSRSWPKGRTTAQWKLPKPPQAIFCTKKCQTKASKLQKAKGKAKPKWNKPYPQNYRIRKKEKTAMDNAFNMARTLIEFKKKE
ncbi:hypothetical protein O181_053649 [Austropuccinia psidii MF-1]|uniref:Uncharacterized protein n=1 Tax=Austropuccinia psidii MF-1 TaxID=1389203 RepID=A0A9Q3E327_9BASI|nr:hypothetical protein [Austropuccinia psidii MF-1]